MTTRCRGDGPQVRLDFADLVLEAVIRGGGLRGRLQRLELGQRGTPPCLQVLERGRQLRVGLGAGMLEGSPGLLRRGLELVKNGRDGCLELTRALTGLARLCGR